jgi:hypothetical protein
MTIQFTAAGKDDLGHFAIVIPGACASCDEATDVTLKYHVRDLEKSLRDMGIDPLTPSLILKRKGMIGVTCGCYAKFQRQVAHISRQREGRTSRR